MKGSAILRGGDMARVFDSVCLPKGGAAVLSGNRTRLRAGVNWQEPLHKCFTV